MNFRSRLRQDAVGFQIAPMIDVVFLLLCFFITSQLFAQWETEIDISLPTAQTGETPQRMPGEVIVNVRQGGEAVVNGQRLDDAALLGMLQKLVAIYPGQPIVVRGDRRTDYEFIVRVLDICRQADVYNISFATASPTEE